MLIGACAEVGCGMMTCGAIVCGAHRSMHLSSLDRRAAVHYVCGAIEYRA